jgi:hypothetical protein
MLVKQAALCVAMAASIGVTGGVAVARAQHAAGQPVARSSAGATSPSPSPTRSRSASPSASPTASRPPATPSRPPSEGRSSSPAPATTPRATPADELSAENLVRERLYYDVTGHSLRIVGAIGPHDPLGPCTGDTTFDDVLPGGVDTTGTVLAGGEATRVSELVAQTRTPAAARAVASDIVSAVDDCPAIQGGDFGYGAPVTVADAAQQVTYFPAYDSDRRYGGYIVFAVGNRAGVVSVSDEIGPEKVATLAREAAAIAAD